MKKALKENKYLVCSIILLVLMILLYFTKEVLKSVFKKWIFILVSSVGIVLIIVGLVFAIIKLNKDHPLRKGINVILDYFRVVLFAVLFVEIIFSFVIFNARVEQTSMVPTLFQDDKVLVFPNREIRNNDIIVFRYDTKIQTQVHDLKDDELLIKRVIAKEGQTFEYKNGVLYINNTEVSDKFYVSSLYNYDLRKLLTASSQLDLLNECIQDDGSLVIPKGWYVVFGDNRVYSIDSREFGLVHESQILGRVDYKINGLFDAEKLK